MKMKMTERRHRATMLGVSCNNDHLLWGLHTGLMTHPIDVIAPLPDDEEDAEGDPE